MKFAHIFILFLLIIVPVYGQNIDSLKLLKLISLKKTGFKKGLSLKQIGDLYQKKNELDSSLTYYNKSLKHFNSAEKKSDVYQAIGMTHFYNSDYEKTLENFKKSLVFAQQTAKDSILARSYSDIGVVYDYLGAYDKSIENYYKALTIFEKNSDKSAMAKIYNNLAIINQNRGQTKIAFDYYKKSLKLKKETKSNAVLIASAYINMGSLYNDTGKYKEAISYFYKALNIYKKNNISRYHSMALYNISDVKFKINELDSAAIYIEKAFEINNRINNNFGLMQNNMFKGKILYEQKAFDSSLLYLNKALLLSDSLKVLDERSKILTELIKVHRVKQNLTKALDYQDELISISDSLSNKEMTDKIETLRIVHETEKKEEEIFSLQKSIKKNKIIQSVVVFVIFLIGLIGFLIYKQKLTKSKYKAELFNQKLLRSQMNPHFIFNVLTSIQSYMFEKNSLKAAMYLSSFAKLTRSILEGSRHDFVSLQEDYETNENYLKIQKMRYDGLFEYSISIDDSLDPDHVQIAPMLIQPFLENSVKHGFKDITYKGHLEVIYKKIGNTLQITVEDNGKGVTDNKEHAHKSHALGITKERLYILNKRSKKNITFSVEHPADKGYKVVFHIPLKVA